MSVIWTIARRELKALFDHATGYILLVVFVAINDFLFFRQVFIAGAATIRPMLELMPWLFLFFVPAIAMRALAEDVRTGTIEVVLAQPVTEMELLLGKYLGQVLCIWIGLAFTLPVPLALSLGGPLPFGVLVAQYFGAALLAAGLTGVGVWASSLTRNQITAFIIGVAVSFVLILVGLDPLLVGLPPVPAEIAARLGVLSHFQDIARGVIDLRDVLYFLTLAGIFLALAYGRLMGRKLSRAGATLKRLRAGVVLLVVGSVVLDLLGGNIGGRLDLTPGKAYTLSPATRQILGHLNDLVTIKFFVSKDLPPQVALLRRDVDDLLQDYRSAGHGKVRVVVEDPSSKRPLQEQAERLGVEPVRFNVVGKSQLSVQQGWFGLAVSYADKNDAIPLIRKTDDLEYRLTSMILGFTDTSKKTVGLVLEPAQGTQPPEFGSLRQELERTYDVRDVNLAADSEPTPDINVLVIAGRPDSLPPPERDRLEAFFRRGGNALVMARGMTMNPRYPFASAVPVAWNSVLKPYGVKVRSDLVDDLLSNRTVGMPTSMGQLIAPYPLWVEGLSTRESPINEEIPGVFLPWTSSIDTAGARPGTVVPLVTTSRGGGIRTGMVPLNPQQDFPRDSLRPRLLAVVVNPLAAAPRPKGPAAKDSSAKDPKATSVKASNTAGSGTAAANAPPKGRIVLVGNADFASDHYANNAPQNLAFALNAIDWLAQDPTLMSIRSKSRTPPPLAFSSSGEENAAEYANVIGVPILIILLGVARLWARREKTHRSYQPLVAGGAS